MDKTAQKRDWMNKLHEMANLPARSAEEFFKPELKRVMETLIQADDVVRATLAGERVGKAVPEDPTPAKDLLKEAKSFINRREYMSAIAGLGRFHKKMQDVANVLDGLKLNVDSLHHQFLFNKLPSKHRQQLEDLGKRFASEKLSYFTKEASVMDFFHNIGSQRGRALAAWEKRYPKVVGKIREGAIAQLEASQDLLNDTLARLKIMASHRASRNIDAYLETGRELSQAFKKYDSGKDGFRNYYTNVIKPYLDTQAKLEQEQNTSSTAKAVGNMMLDQSQKALENQKLPEETTLSDSDVISIPPSSQDTVLPPPPNVPVGIEPFPPRPNSSTIPSPPPVPSTIPPSNPPKGFKADEVAEELFGKKTSSYDAFVNSLEVFSNEDPAWLATHIAKYANSIQSEQPETAIKLFKIAKSLRV